MNDPAVDETHAIVTRKRGWYEIKDPGSARGTLVGDVPLKTSTPRVLPWHSIVSVGAVRLELMYGERPYALFAKMGAPDVARAALLREQQERDSYPVRLVLVEGESASSDRVALPPRARPYAIGASPLCDFRIRGENIPDVAVQLVVAGSAIFASSPSAIPLQIGQRRLASADRGSWSIHEMLTIGGFVFALEDPLRVALRDYENELRGMPVGRRRSEAAEGDAGAPPSSEPT